MVLVLLRDDLIGVKEVVADGGGRIVVGRLHVNVADASLALHLLLLVRLVHFVDDVQWSIPLVN